MDLRNVIEAFDIETSNDWGKDFIGLLFVALDGGIDGRGKGPFGDDCALMTFGADCFCFYVVPNTLMRVPKHTAEIMYKAILPYDRIADLKIRKFLMWRYIKILIVDNDGTNHKLDIAMSTKVLQYKDQKESVETLLSFIETSGLKK